MFAAIRRAILPLVRMLLDVQSAMSSESLRKLGLYELLIDLYFRLHGALAARLAPHHVNLYAFDRARRLPVGGDPVGGRNRAGNVDAAIDWSRQPARLDASQP